MNYNIYVEKLKENKIMEIYFNDGEDKKTINLENSLKKNETLNIILIEIEDNFDDYQESVLKNLNEKYDIITLLINDLIRYLNISENAFLEDETYEGIYPHSINIEERINLIFDFLIKNYSFMFEGRKHIERLYQLLKPKK